jgi:hypothetical protein
MTASPRHLFDQSTNAVLVHWADRRAISGAVLSANPAVISNSTG